MKPTTLERMIMRWKRGKVTKYKCVLSFFFGGLGSGATGCSWRTCFNKSPGTRFWAHEKRLRRTLVGN